MISKNYNLGLKVPQAVWSLATDSKGNVYVGTRSDLWKGGIYRASAGGSEFKRLNGVEEEVWSIAIDDNGNIYVGTIGGKANGGVYKCLVDKEYFKKMSGINKCATSLRFDKDGNLYALVWAGDSLETTKDKATYQCLKGETEFKLIEQK